VNTFSITKYSLVYKKKLKIKSNIKKHSRVLIYVLKQDESFKPLLWNSTLQDKSINTKFDFYVLKQDLWNSTLQDKSIDTKFDFFQGQNVTD